MCKKNISGTRARACLFSRINVGEGRDTGPIRAGARRARVCMQGGGTYLFTYLFVCALEVTGNPSRHMAHTCRALDHTL